MITKELRINQLSREAYERCLDYLQTLDAKDIDAYSGSSRTRQRYDSGILSRSQVRRQSPRCSPSNGGVLPKSSTT